MKTKLNGILTLFLVLVVQVAFAQQTVTGKVIDASGEPILGATVLVRGSSNATTTDFDGNYSIQANATDVLSFSFSGYDSKNVTVGNQTTINVTLSASLEAVVVTGYRTTTAPRSNVASTTISAEKIENRPNASFVQTLSGQVAGLNITTGSGQPGANSLVQIRGVNSINGNTEPLFIIDGAPVDEDNFRSLNPQDIASISVLKDAGATAIYGNRGANGVIIIKTKAGGFEQPLSIRTSSILSYTTLPDNDYNLYDAAGYLRLEREFGVGRGAGRATGGVPLTDAEIDAAESTDWLDVFFRTGVTKNNTVSLSSGGKKTTQYTSLGYFEQDGILVQSSLQRFNFRNNMTGRSENDKFNYASNFTANYSTNDEPNSIGSGAVNRNYLLGANSSLPYLLVSDYTPGEGGSLAPLLRNAPLFLLDRLETYTRKEEEIKLIGSFTASWEFAKNLTARSVSGADYQNVILTRSEGPTSFNSVFFAETGEDLPGTQDQQTTRQFTFNQTTSLNYNNTWGKHSLDVGLFTEYFKAHLRTFGFRQQGLDPRTFSPGDGSGFVGFDRGLGLYDDIANANILNAGLFSYFGSADYDYDSKYGLGLAYRRDASYRFAQSNRYATFYSISGRWNIGKEDFMDDSVFDALKLRASYGTSGNQRITGPGYFSGNNLTRDLYATAPTYGGQQALTLFTPGGIAGVIANPFLEWETVAQANVGIDFEIFDSRLRGSIDGYIKKTESLFQNTPTSALVGTFGLSANTGSLYNRGFDFELYYDVIRGQENGDFELDVFVNGNFNKTELEDIPSEAGFIPGIGQNGGRLFEYYAVRQVGVNPANGELLFLDADGNLTESPNVESDRVFLDKNIIPEFQGGFGLNASFKGFYVQSQFNYVVGVDRFDGDLAGFQDEDDIGQFNLSRDLERAWTPDNRITDIPSLNATNLNLDNTDRYLREADYLRMRFLSLGYNFQPQMLEKAGLNSLNIFVNAENLVTFTKWRGFDVEARDNGSRGYPTPKIISLGVEIGI
ncbi:SusC/RagA family TonB-linked outer membrane protein [Nonlabens ponticola]|uniref:SusC/RagA family TonB-linked outer membrane protein n=1 Tax=Nonlabens ponticola TaxID=2496866 RepID=A0A3S9N0U0_9FLAO|nr:SusC/RagA family TonB-linked outer membrane protein [Nonlabens ponticola]AZQ45009.1 SusC/RagA family TonB-linked outer membrane protein [Nonlabens ponticola]